MAQKICIKESNGKEKEIGTIYGKTFCKVVKKSKHFYRNTYSWGIDNEVYEKIILPNTDTIKILDKENKKVYETATANFKINGSYIHYSPHRKQILLNINYFIVKEYKK